MIRSLSAPELADWLADPQRAAPILLDVREHWEVATCVLSGAQHIPIADIPARVAELDRTRAIVCYCHHGMRSLQVLFFLQAQGFQDIWNLDGGIDAWARRVDPSCPTY